MTQPTGDFRREGIRPRSGEVVSGNLLLTIGTPDGSEARPCPDEWLPRPRRAGQRPAPARSRVAEPPVLDREADVAQLLALLAEGKSVRLVGQSGSGRSTLLRAVGEAAGDLLRDGVVRLSGRRRTGADLLQELFAATHHAPDFRPDRRQLTALLAGVAAVVVIDDVEPEDEELEELLATAPECAFLIAAAPDAPELPAGSRLRDHLVAGLSRPASLELTARRAGRPLDEIERAWAVDLWFESEGLPVRFVQAAALLRQRDVAVDALVAAQEDRTSLFGVVAKVAGPADPVELEQELRREVPLPTVAETAAPAVRLADGLSEPALIVLRLGLAFGGVIPTAPHLPALVDVDQGETALTELIEHGLAIPCGGHYRLVTGVRELLAERLDTGGIADGAAQHFSWWVGHGSVSTAQIGVEAEVLIGALLADRAAGRWPAVLQLARAAAPALALALRWGAWERALQLGLEAARATENGSEEAWFQHELGVLAFCQGAREWATAELESGVALRATLGELRGNAAARRMLELLRSGPDAAAETAALPVAPGRRPVIRSIAPVAWRFSPVVPEGWRRRRPAIIVGVAVLGLGVLGTAVAMSLSGPDTPPGQVQQEPVVDGTLPSGLFGSSASPSATAPAPSDSATASPTASPSESSSHHAGAKPSDTPTSDPGTQAPTEQAPPSQPSPRPHPSTTPAPSTTPSPSHSSESPSPSASQTTSTSSPSTPPSIP